MSDYPNQEDKKNSSKQEILLENVVSAIDRKVISTYGKKLTTSFEESKKDITNKEIFITFSLSEVKYAIPINRVLEIGTMPKVTTIPKTPSWLLGVTNLRGDIFSVVDLRTFLSLGQVNSATARMMVVRTQNEDFSTILMVDKVTGLIPIALKEVKEPTAPIQNKLALFLIGFYTDKEQPLALFNIDKLLISSELRQFESL
ncbi:MAG: chemotaxis protein CheW [Acidobacteria bacterium]|nr:chemotaxis protein CheW [Acidobacteriota bacterium]